MFILLIYVFIIILFLSGQEWENVILSTVRSLPAHKVEVKSTTEWKNQHLGHLVNQGKVNLALTRAKKRLIILGEIGKHVKNSDVCMENKMQYLVLKFESKSKKLCVMSFVVRI